MNRYRQLTSGERYALSALRKQGCNQAQRPGGDHRILMGLTQHSEDTNSARKVSLCRLVGAG